MQRVADALLIVILVLQAAFLLEVHIPVAGHDIDAPLADLAACGLVALLPLAWKGTLVRPPAASAYALLLVVFAISATWLDPELSRSSHAAAFHWIARKPLFVYVAYAVAMPVFLATWPSDKLRAALYVGIGTTAALSVGTSLLRIGGGDTLQWAAIPAITNNHKTLAAWLAPWVPWLWWASDRPAGKLVLGLTGAALLLALSKSAWLVALFGAAFAIHYAGRPLISRGRAVGAIGALAVVAMLVFARSSDATADALDARVQLDRRAADMWVQSPWIGQGPGTSTTWEIHVAPDWRVNGIDAHGAIQKVGSEAGTLGLLAWFAFVIGLAAALLAKWDGSTTSEGWAWLGVAAALGVGLIQSTDTFNLGTWVPLGVAWAALSRPPAPKGP